MVRLVSVVELYELMHLHFSSCLTYVEELAELLALLVVVWWVPGDVGWLAVEEI